MNRLLLAALGLIVSGSAAHASPIFDFTFTGSIVNFTVPTSDLYQILAFGAQGGSANGFGFVGSGGDGAEIGGNFGLAAGEILQVAVGGMGGANPAGGGGGGSFVIGPSLMPLVVAGGGGGGGATVVGGFSGQGGLIGMDGGGGFDSPGGTVGNGGGGGEIPGGGGGGGGLLSDGGAGSRGGRGGPGFLDLVGVPFDDDGGFAGGGESGPRGGGGGGGYSGGAGGNGGAVGSGPGFGGGSFDAGTDQIMIADIHSGNGEVIITEVPEPGSLALLGTGLLLAACLFLPSRR